MGSRWLALIDSGLRATQQIISDHLTTFQGFMITLKTAVVHILMYPSYDEMFNELFIRR